MVAAVAQPAECGWASLNTYVVHIRVRDAAPLPTGASDLPEGATSR